MKYQGNVRTVYDPSLGSFAIFETEDDAQRLAHANNQSGSSAEFKAVWDEERNGWAVACMSPEDDNQFLGYL